MSDVEAEQPCHFCGKVAECRPYGPGGYQICFACASLPMYERIVAKNCMEIMFEHTPTNDEITKFIEFKNRCEEKE